MIFYYADIFKALNSSYYIAFLYSLIKVVSLTLYIYIKVTTRLRLSAVLAIARRQSILISTVRLNI